MTQKENQYFRFSRILLLIIGLWPYQQSNFTRFQQIFISAIFIAIIIFQLTTFLTLSCTSELITKVLSSAFYVTFYIIKYNGFRVNIRGVKDLLMQLQHIHEKLTDENEIAIIKKYDCIAKRYIAVLTTFAICGIFGVIIAQFWINMVDDNLSMNVSRSYHFLFTMEYFIDQEKYFYLILLHINAAVCIGSTTILATGTMLITYIQHICGIFKVASYRIEYAININILQNVTLKNKIWMTKDVMYAVDIHRQAMKLSKRLVSKLETMLFCSVVPAVASLSLCLFQIVLSINDIKKYLLSFLCASVCILYMFLANLMAQIVIDHNNHVFVTAYNVQWYKTPLHMQRMILFLLQIGTKKFTLNIGGLFDGSMECFATLMKASLSYFTFIYSTR